MKELALTLPGGEQVTSTGVPNVTISPVIQFALGTVFVIAVLLALFLLVFGGISFIASGGEKEKIVKARLRITYAIVGLIIIFLSFFIVNLIGYFFGVNILNIQPEAFCQGGACITP